MPRAKEAKIESNQQINKKYCVYGKNMFHLTYYIDYNEIKNKKREEYEQKYIEFLEKKREIENQKQKGKEWKNYIHISETSNKKKYKMDYTKKERKSDQISNEHEFNLKFDEKDKEAQFFSLYSFYNTLSNVFFY